MCLRAADAGTRMEGQSRQVSGGIYNQFPQRQRTVLRASFCESHTLERFDDSEFLKIERLEPDAADIAYCRFLQGNFAAVDANALPSRYAGVLKAVALRDSRLAAHEISAIGDPLSRLVATGAWVNHMPYDETILQKAIDMAAANGWRRPLWAYLEKLCAYYLEIGDKSKAEVVKNRLELLKKEKDKK